MGNLPTLSGVFLGSESLNNQETRLSLVIWSFGPLDASKNSFLSFHFLGFVVEEVVEGLGFGELVRGFHFQFSFFHLKFSPTNDVVGNLFQPPP